MNYRVRRYRAWRKSRKDLLTRNERWFFNALFVLCFIGLGASIANVIMDFA